MKSAKKYGLFLAIILAVSIIATALNVYMYHSSYDYEKNLLNGKAVGLAVLAIGVIAAVISFICAFTVNKRELPSSLLPASVGVRIGAGIAAIAILAFGVFVFLKVFPGDGITKIFYSQAGSGQTAIKIWLVKIFTFSFPIASAYFVALMISGKSNIILGTVSTVWCLILETFIYYDISVVMNDPVRLSMICALSAVIVSLIIDVDSACERVMSKTKTAFQLICVFVLFVTGVSPLYLYIAGKLALSSMAALYGVIIGTLIITISRAVSISGFKPQETQTEAVNTDAIKPENVEKDADEETVQTVSEDEQSASEDISTGPAESENDPQ
ncbi:MAG: hypothetical protein J5850_04085 [Clostridia bacterium]|nr:hypothetical protein [Clostridia bacterium]